MNNSQSFHLKKLKSMYSSIEPDRPTGDLWKELAYRLKPQDSPNFGTNYRFGYIFAAIVILVLAIAVNRIDSAQLGDLLYPIKITGQNTMNKLFRIPTLTPTKVLPNAEQFIQLQNIVPTAESRIYVTQTVSPTVTITPTIPGNQNMSGPSGMTKGVETELKDAEKSLSPTEIKQKDSDSKKLRENEEDNNSKDKKKSQKKESEKKESFWKKIFKKSK